MSPSHAVERLLSETAADYNPRAPERISLPVMAKHTDSLPCVLPTLPPGESSCRARRSCCMAIDSMHVSQQTEAFSPYALRIFSVRRTPRACHGACDHLRPGRLRASHAVCLRYPTLEPVLCARKEEADIESVSTAERIMSQLSAMRSLNPSFRTDSFHSSSASSARIPTTFPDGFRSEVTANNALQRTAPGCHGSCYSRSGVSPSCHLLTSSGALSALHLRSYRASPPRSLSLSR